ncbi:MAG: ribosomal L7Ae/L30e/S12e/Gadd45 family protein [Erysipelotrichales bacterium]|nr:ribosomal L7Ae/L30e/S12e/Gadd45 family protein [Erysipelotrichales bacterium]
MNNVVNLIGLATRARKIVTGEMVLNAIRNHSAKLVVIAEDASDNTKKKLIDKCTFYNVEYVFIESSAILSHAIGKNNRMAIAINDLGFAEKIKNYLKG